MARLEVPAHALLANDEPFDEPREAVEHVVDGEEGVGNDDALGGGVRDVALVPERDVLEADDGCSAHDTGQPADALGDDGVPLVRHRRRALLPAAERLLHLGDLRAREVPDLERELVERRRDDRERGQQLGVPVALEDLRRRRRRLEAEPLARAALELGIGRCVRSDRAGELADPHPLERPRDPLPVPVELERPAGELQPERRRLGVHAVRAAHLEGRAMLLRARDDGGERARRGPPG